MDNFMDKLAQKFNAQDVIHANTEAETAEMMRLKQQVAEYEKILQEMRKLNYKNMELSEKIATVISDKTSEMSQVQREQKEILAALQNLTDEQTRNLEQSLSDNTEEEERAKQELLERTKENLEQIEQLIKDSDDFTHKESVKVYRNVQAVLIEELNKQTEQLTLKVEAANKKAAFSSIMSVLTFVLVGVGIVLQILSNFGVFPF